MKSKMYLLLFSIAFLVSCEKETFTPKNYLKATINGNPFIAYQDNRLNNDTVPGTFSFSFGQTVWNHTDTCLFLSACLNRNNLCISFPKPTGNTTYTIYRQSNNIGEPSAFYSLVPEYLTETDIEIFYTTENVLNIENIEGQPIGEITIDKIDTKTRQIEGHFNFSVYGYEVTDTYAPTNNVIGITNGEFYYQWDKSLNL